MEVAVVEAVVEVQVSKGHRELAQLPSPDEQLVVEHVPIGVDVPKSECRRRRRSSVSLSFCSSE